MIYSWVNESVDCGRSRHGKQCRRRQSNNPGCCGTPKKQLDNEAVKIYNNPPCGWKDPGSSLLQPFKGDRDTTGSSLATISWKITTHSFHVWLGLTSRFCHVSPIGCCETCGHCWVVNVWPWWFPGPSEWISQRKLPTAPRFMATQMLLAIHPT